VIESVASRAAAIERRVLYERLKPPPRLTLSEWANRYRVLSPEASFRVGQYSTDDAPYQREPMDCISDPRVRQVVCRWGSQLGKTECFINNPVGYYIDQDPAPILVLQPTLEMAEAWSKDRLAPMLRDTPRLAGKVASARARDSGNTLLHKTVPGGHITVAGANSPAGLASRPIRILLEDEIDRYPESAGAEGDPTAIAESRTSTFPNVKIVKVSTCTIEGSPIDCAWLGSDQRWRWWPCPHCGHEQKMEFGGPDTPFGLKWDEGLPHTAHYVCMACAAVIEESDKRRMDKDGRWIAENEHSVIPGFTLSALYSPFFTWSRLVERFLRDKRDPLKLRSFVNTILCENWKDSGEEVDEHVLHGHLEPFPRGEDPENTEMLVPHGAGVLTRSVDVQGDRLETAVYGWGDEEECWRVDFEVIPGDPATKTPWLRLAEVIGKQYKHVTGAIVPVAVTFLDSGGHHSKEVYAFARKHRAENVYATKGSSLQEGVQLVSEPRHWKSAGVVAYVIGSFSAKEALMKRLLKVLRPEPGQPGPKYIHLPDDMDPVHVDQFLAEKLVSKIVNGRIKRVWIQKGANEQIDLWCMALAALNSIKGVAPRLAELAARYSEYVKPETPDVPVDAQEVPRRRPRRNKWVYGPMDD